MNEETRKWLCRRAIQAAPLEACGFIMEDGDIIEIRNVATNPAKGFRMDKSQLFEKLSDRIDFIQGIWHTHPSGSLRPSHTDLNAIKIGAIQPNWDYWIVTSEDIAYYPAKSFAPQQDSFWLDFVKVRP